MENLADSQEQYQMAFIKCQYMNAYLKKVSTIIQKSMVQWNK